ncbi:MAG: YceI family protein [Xanthomonadales bacterium]|nr:YceI family protein [Xanthomonadales bacterium]
MRHVLSFILLMFLNGLSQAAHWKQQDDSTLGFSGSAQGEAFDGQFKQFTADIRFGPEDIGNARFDVRIRLDSVDSANSERDDTLRSADFFNVAAKPEARYVAEDFERSDGGFIANGKLTLNGKTADVPLRFQFKVSDSSATLDGEATLNRLDFNVGGGDWADPSMIDTAVTVSTHLELKASQ